MLIADEEAVTGELERVAQELVVVRGHDDEEPSRIVEAWTCAVIRDVVRDDVIGRAVQMNAPAGVVRGVVARDGAVGDEVEVDSVFLVFQGVA